MSHLPRKVLLATDGSEDARLAARAAASLAGNAGAELHVVHAWQSVPHPAIDADYYEEGARRILEEQLEFVSGSGAAASEGHLVMGPPVDVILDLAEELGAELIVMGARGHGTLARLLLGSVSEGVMHHATRPVLVMRGGESAWPPQRVVIGEDGSNAAKRAGEMAASIGALYGARGILVRAYPELPEADRVGRTLDPRLVDDALRRAERELHERAGELASFSGATLRIGIAAGDTAAAILAKAREGVGDATLIAVGSRGLGPVGRLRLGSVSTNVLRAAEGPVLVYPHTV